MNEGVAVLIKGLVDAGARIQGPCAFCGAENAAHRLWDAIDGRVRAGESVAEVVRDYDISSREVRNIAARHRKARKQHKRLPGR